MTISAELKEKGIEIVIDFVTAIGSRNFDAMSLLLSDNSLVQTYRGLVIQGSMAVMNYWKNKLNNLPDYKLEIEEASVKDKKILLIGVEGDDYSEEGNAIWEVSTEKDKITFWREYYLAV